MESALAAYLTPRIPGCSDMVITNLLRIPGGASRETWMFDAAWNEGPDSRLGAFILRKDPPASLVESDRELEYAFYDAFRGTKVPVPNMRWLEQDPAYLGGAFFIMERIVGCDSNTHRIFEADYNDSRDAIARQFYEILAAIHAADWSSTDIPSVIDIPGVDDAWKRELAYWEGMIDRNEISPQPIARAAIRWLRANPPPAPARVGVVHGDYRVGNFLYTPKGITGIVDWEMAHVGDPLEDIAWSFMELWEFGNDGKKGGIISADDAIRAYESASGATVDRNALHWWEVFSGVKGQGIWLTGARSFQDGRSQELMHAFTSWGLINRQDEMILRTLGRGA